MRTFWIGLLAVALVLATLAFMDRARPPETRAAVGFGAPHFALRSLDGKLVRLSDYQGQVVFLNFWATWCAPCRAELPDIQAMARARGDAVQVILIDVVEWDWDAAPVFLRQLGIDLLTVQDRTDEVRQAYLVRNLPTSFILDRRGVIRTIWMGLMPRDEMDAAVDRALEGR